MLSFTPEMDGWCIASEVFVVHLMISQEGWNLSFSVLQPKSTAWKTSKSSGLMMKSLETSVIA
ncbi:hypothetical protein RA28_10785 [Ruegeria sp. ANG-S4]|nr:hypothetical protein RA28_10785 [Ruegeria sp. ANG-S4]